MGEAGASSQASPPSRTGFDFSARGGELPILLPPCTAQYPWTWLPQAFGLSYKPSAPRRVFWNPAPHIQSSMGAVRAQDLEQDCPV